MKRPWHIAVLFGAAMAVVLAAMAWVSTTVLRLDRAQRESQRQAAIEENVRLALWRMDSTATSLITQETARPWTGYASPAAGEPISPQVLLHFQINPSGLLHSPEVLQPLRLQRVHELEEVLAGVGLAEQLPAITSQPMAPVVEQAVPQLAVAPPQQPEGQRVSPAEQQQAKNVREFQARSSNYYNGLVMNQAQLPVMPATDASIGMMRPLWVGDKLLLARRVRIVDQQYMQGAWLNWAVIRQDLLASIADLLPHADLEPAPAGADARETRMMASLPVRLLPGDLPAPAGNGRSPLVVSLSVAWVCVLLAGGAVAALLLSAVTLSERRAAFVSAVTHELRTPLTTLRMYAEMLGAGMISDEPKRQSYLDTMRSEADRLAHLVENVLAYSRLERGRARRHVEVLSLGELIERSAPRLRQRAEGAGMSLRVEPLGDAGEATIPSLCARGLSTSGGQSVLAQRVRVDVSAAEQILFNLVDNACKYAAAASDRTLHVQAASASGRPEIRVCDHGPGIPAGERARLFHPFSKSAHDAANSAPGVGLGLALSRRLAREMGGDLRFVPTGKGACFALWLARPL